MCKPAGKCDTTENREKCRDKVYGQWEVHLKECSFLQFACVQEQKVNTLRIALLNPSWDFVEDTARCSQAPEHYTTEEDGKPSASVHPTTFMLIIYMLVQRQRPHARKLKSPIVHVGVIFHCHNSLKCGRDLWQYTEREGGVSGMVFWWNFLFCMGETQKGKKWHSCLLCFCCQIRHTSQELFWIISSKLLLILVLWLLTGVITAAFWREMQLIWCFGVYSSSIPPTSPWM